MASLSDLYDWLGNIGKSAQAGLSGAANTLEGDPNGLAAQMQQLSNQAQTQGQQVKDFLLSREGNAENYYKPMQQMFGQMYGTGGIKPAMAPGVPGSTPINGGA